MPAGGAAGNGHGLDTAGRPHQVNLARSPVDQQSAVELDRVVGGAGKRRQQKDNENRVTKKHQENPHNADNQRMSIAGLGTGYG